MSPLQCSCLENPRDGGAWWAAVYGVAQSWTRLKWLSNNESVNFSLPAPVLHIVIKEILYLNTVIKEKEKTLSVRPPKSNNLTLFDF